MRKKNIPSWFSQRSKKTYVIYEGIKNPLFVKNKVYRPIGKYFELEAKRLLELDNNLIAKDTATGKLKKVI